MHRTEPYVYAQMIAGKDAVASRRGQELVAHRHRGVELRRRLPVPARRAPGVRRALVQPCIGKELASFTIRRKCRGARLRIQVKNSGKAGRPSSRSTARPSPGTWCLMPRRVRRSTSSAWCEHPFPLKVHVGMRRPS